MAYVGPRNYVVVVLHVGGSKASYIKLVLQREPIRSQHQTSPLTGNLYCTDQSLHLPQNIMLSTLDTCKLCTSILDVEVVAQNTDPYIVVLS
jgi:hypothetical protein